MIQVTIEDAITNSPSAEVTRHFRFSDEWITNAIVEERRIRSYFVPSAQTPFHTEWTPDRVTENDLINDIRRPAATWRRGGYIGVTGTTSRLLAYWTYSGRKGTPWTS